MAAPAQILILEDRWSDRQLLLAELKLAELDFHCRWAENRAEYLAQLSGEVDVILSDYRLPDLNGMEALHLLKEKELEIPFVLVSATIGDELAAAIIQAGAFDFLLKDRLNRLGTSVKRALEQKRLRSAQRKAEADLKASQDFTECLLNSSLDMIIATDPHRRIVRFNTAAEAVFGYRAEEVIGQSVEMLYADKEQVHGIHTVTLQTGHCVREILNRRKSGETFPSYLAASAVKDAAGEVIGYMGISRDVSLEKKAQKELVEAKSLFHSLVETLPVGVYRKNKEGELLFANQILAKLLCRPVEEILGKTSFDLFPREQAAKLQINEQEVLRHGEVREEVLELGGEDSPAHFQIIQTAVHDSRGKVTGTQGIIWNISERVRVEQELRATKQRLESLFASSPAMMYTLAVEQASFRPLWVSENITRLLGYSPREALSSDWWKSNVHPEDRIKAMDTLPRLFQRDQLSTEYRFRHQNGQYRWMRDEMRLFRDDSGQPRHVTGVWLDVSEQHHFSEQLKQQSQLLDLASDAILVRDLNDRVLYWSKGAETLYGWSAEEATGKIISDLIYKSTEQLHAATKVAKEKGVWTGELSQVHRSGTDILVNSRFTLLRDDQGQPKSLLVINTDITAQKKLENQYLRAQRLESIGTLASGIAHDLNNILAPILMSVQILNLQERDPKDRKIIDTIESNAQRGTEVVRQVLTFARGMEGDRVLVQLHHLVKDLAKIMRETFPKSIRIQQDIGKELWPVTGDATQLHQVLLNLCVNARDAMTEGGILTIRARNLAVDQYYASQISGGKPGNFVLAEVRDTGSGIPESVIDKIFDPFFTTKPQGQGTGLGLSTVLGIVKSHDGFISVQSEYGKGSTFKVFLPASPGAQIEITDKPHDQLPHGQGELILVVDDEESIRATTESLLKSFGYEVVLAEDGSDAVAVFARHMERIKVVLTDLMMPYLDGVMAIRAMKKMRPSIKVIAASGLNQEAKTAELNNLGVKTFLTKPFHAEKLLRALDHEIRSPANG